MITFAMDTIDAQTSVRARPAYDPRAVWAGIATRYRRQRLLAKLSRYPPRLLLDMGLTPEEVSAALEGSWDEVHPERLYRRNMGL